ncbi:MAG: RnfABCDGE type electron transport complex subunit D [Candidatus Delongbacteria bacterium]|nr:RnfABCDGE type electron transport complex subunit D [Candidatus Delongbacteria bacterium]MCG2760311.1 RnfABCDGE type electron transport complex subunit D [Candidatus Delongbacteria bacterium]
MDKMLIVSANPHIRDKSSITKVMHTVNITLLPAIFASYWFFGFRAILLILVAIVSCVITEAAIQKFRKKPVTVYDGSAILTGILLGFNVPANIPWWIVMLGSIFAIAIAKQAFGGLGFNIFNPALIGRAFMVASWPVQMTSNAYWTQPYSGKTMDAISSATPLNLVKTALKAYPNQETINIIKDAGVGYMDLFIGNVSGCIGETSFLALLAGVIVLIALGIVNWRVPLFYIGTVFILTWLMGYDPVFHILAGGLALGAFYMATDMVTSPITNKGNIIFATGLGLLTVAIRIYGGYPEGVSYSILLMNTAVPLINKFTVPKKFGFVEPKRA